MADELRRAGELPGITDEILATYRAKAWIKGRLPAAVDERHRTVRSVNVSAR